MNDVELLEEMAKIAGKSFKEFCDDLATIINKGGE